MAAPRRAPRPAGAIDEYQLESLLLEQRLSGMLFGELLVRSASSPRSRWPQWSPSSTAFISPPKRDPPRPPRRSPGSGVRSAASSWTRSCSRRAAFSACCSSQRRHGGLARGHLARTRLCDAGAARRGARRAARPCAGPEELAPRTDQRRAVRRLRYEVRPHRTVYALHVTPSFLDASDFAFELLYDAGPRRARDRRGEGRRAADRLVVRAAGGGRLSRARGAALGPPRTASRPASISSGSAKNPWNMPS